MPIYEYECAECGVHFDKLQRFGDPSPDTCPNGHQQVHRLLSHPTIIFKGSGFYVTDNGRSSRSTASRNGSGSMESKQKSSAESDSAASPKTEEKTKE
ncbi:MAG TPA: zinc ribbon domain-containing protein [Anaerolineae bacterium]|nr:zinc ribbon domain-containing protein [Anaerolineae bacterium]